MMAPVTTSRTFSVLAATAGVVVATACQRPASAPAHGSAPNIVVVLADTLRADHMSLYGYRRATTPVADRLARESFVFERARAQAGCTFPSVNALFTSRYPFDFNRQGELQMGIPERFPTLAQVLEAHGYATAAVSTSPIVRVSASDANPNGGFGAGFQVFDESVLWNAAEAVNRRAEAVLPDLPEPFFLYLHYMDPHDPYAPPASHRRRFARQYDGHDFIAAGDINPIAKMLFADGPEIELTDADVRHLVDLYDDEILYFDTQLAELLQILEDRGLLQRTLLVVTSDHGEEFFEHDQVGHCRGVWDTLTRVPLLLRVPGLEGGSRISSPVQLVDLLPTLLDLANLSAAGLDLEGVSLRPLLEGRSPTRSFAFADQSRYRAADDGRWQLVLDGVSSITTLFDLVEDPLAQRDLFAAGRPEVDRLGDALNGWLQDTGQWVEFDKALAASRAKEEQLRELGYLH